MLSVSVNVNPFILVGTLYGMVVYNPTTEVIFL